MLKCVFPVDADLFFPISEGGRLRFARGGVPCGVTLERVIRSRDDLSDAVVAQVEVADATGRRFGLTRHILGTDFLPLISSGEPCPRVDDVEQELSNIQCRFLSRRYLPAVGSVDGTAVGFSYYTKNLILTMDLLVMRSKHGDDALVIRVHPSTYGGIGVTDTPRVQVRTAMTAVVLLSPSTFALEFSTEPLEVLQFQQLDGEANPEPLVTYLP